MQEWLILVSSLSLYETVMVYAPSLALIEVFNKCLFFSPSPLE